jgi:hypothetical protein
MGTSPDQLSGDIASTRAELAEDVNRLVDRTSPRRMAERRVSRVKGAMRNVREKVMGASHETRDRTQRAVEQAQDAAGEVPGKVSDAAQSATDQLRQRTEGNPLAAGLIAFGAGLLAASLIPASRTEERLVQDLQERTSGLVDPVREAALESAQSVREGLQTSVQESVSEVKSAAGEAVDATKEEAKHRTQQMTEGS